MHTLSLFGLDIDAVSFAEAVSLLRTILAGDGPAKVVVTPNTDQIVKLSRDPALLQHYRRADFIFADGFPLVVASRLLHGGQGCRERVTGADLFPALCQVVAGRGGRIFLLGGHPGQQEGLRAALKRKYPAAAFEVFSPSLAFSPDSAEGREAAACLNGFRPELTFVCLGMPKQELWSLRYRSELATRLICCFGAAFEFDLGLVRRAPRLLQKMGLEWLWRLMGNPKKLGHRYLLDDPYFAILLFRELLQKKQL